ncbi:MAG: ribose 5-phosphate isomerase B [Nitrospiraceae bacterium]|nr:ribose 5-phosphate isomerase B [Nitrospiraceae bacterium]
MKIVITADHAGFPLKAILVTDLTTAGHEVTDLGTNSADSPVDYPDIATLACETVRSGNADRAIILCGSGVGVTVAANKFPGIRAGLCHDHYSAHQGVEHDDMNVLCMGARILGQEPAREIAQAFASAQYTAEKRHARRLDKVKAIEAKYTKG